MVELIDRQKTRLGVFEQGVHELHRSSHALAEALDEFKQFNENGDLARLHFRKGLTAIQLAETRIPEAKKKLESFYKKELFEMT